jgi:dihydroneopterin aldolase
MTDKKTKEVSADVMMADIMLRLTAIEKLLIDKNIFTQEEFFQTMEEIAKKVSQVLLEKVQAMTAEQKIETELPPLKPHLTGTDINKN